MTTTSERKGRRTARGSVGAWPYEADEPQGTRLGVSLSGGGIRAATFALGVYQRLAEAGIFQRARYLSAVSGGSYLAAGLAISHALCPDDLRDAEPAPWARGSPEETRLRSNLSYLASGSSGRLWLVANFVYGLILNLTPLLLAAFVGGRVLGLVLRWVYPGIGGRGSVDLMVAPWLAVAGVVLVFGSLMPVGVRRFFDKGETQKRVSRSTGERGVTTLLSAAGALAVLFGLVPLLVYAMARSMSHRLITDLGLEGWSWHAQRLAVGLLAVMFGLALGGIAVWLVQRRRLSVVRGVLAVVAGASVLMFPFLLATETGAVRPWTWSADGPQLIGAVAVIFLFAIFAHNRRYSMHLFYRERIQEAFASRRVATPVGGVGAEPVPYQEKIKLSAVAAANLKRTCDAGPAFPELLICAAVAARDSEVPSKARAGSFTFGATWCGNRRLGLRAKTVDVEKGGWIGGGNLTLPSMIAISGAAVSPLMGRFTLPAFRFLMAVMNIRLGVWIRHPDVKSDATRLETRNVFKRAWRYCVDGWREPGAWYVLKEGLGLAGTRGRFIYVSDGGHWENLGLTELVRRRCTNVIVIDASGDPGLGDIGRAMAMCRAELGVEIRLDPRNTLPGESKHAKTPIAVGSIDYPDGTHGNIVYARSVLWDGAPSDLQILASRDAHFPNHPTTNQFLSGELFDAYRALGYAVGESLADAVHLQAPKDDEPRQMVGARLEDHQDNGSTQRRSDGDRRQHSEPPSPERIAG